MPLAVVEATVEGEHVFANTGTTTQSSPAAATGNLFFRINDALAIVDGDIGSWFKPGDPPSSGPFVVEGTSHWRINGLSMARLGDLAPPLSGATAQGPQTHFSV